jgi:transposase
MSEDKLSEIRELSKKRLDGEERIRLACVYSVGSGKSVKWVCDHLLLQERTVFRYLADYHEKGKVGPGGDGINGRPSKLTEEESKDLKEHLRNNIYRSTKAIIQHIKAKYGVSYSEGGLAKWLSKAGFRYKRPKLVPYTVSAEKQKEFIEIYNKMKAEKKEEEVILFMDGVHPNHQTQNVHGWIERSKLALSSEYGKAAKSPLYGCCGNSGR